MVDATFLFVVLLGGALVGLVTARVRGHDRRRASLEILVGMVAGFAGGPLWIAFAENVLPVLVPPSAELGLGWLFLLSDAYYVSPIVAAFVAMALVALGYRWIGGARREESWLALSGDVATIVGIVYLTVSLCLTLALIAAAAYFGRWDLISPAALLIDLSYGAAFVLAGWSMSRLARQPV